MSDQESVVAALSRILRGVPKMTGARCVGQWRLFDARGADEEPDAARQRHEQAVDLCRRCPVLEQCATFAEGERDVGQVRAGRMPKPPSPRGRKSV